MRALDQRLMRYTLAAVWLVTGLLSLGLYPQAESLRLLSRVGLQGNAALLALYGSAALGMFTLHPLVIPAIPAPEFWLHPFCLLKWIHIFSSVALVGVGSTAHLSSQKNFTLLHFIH